MVRKVGDSGSYKKEQYWIGLQGGESLNTAVNLRNIMNKDTSKMTISTGNLEGELGVDSWLRGDEMNLLF